MNSHQRRKVFRKARRAFRKMTLPTMGGVFGQSLLPSLPESGEIRVGMAEMPPLFDLKRTVKK